MEKEGEKEISGENGDNGGRNKGGKGNIGEGAVKGGTRVWEGRSARAICPSKQNSCVWAC
jgi:hypothetical protein